MLKFAEDRHYAPRRSSATARRLATPYDHECAEEQCARIRSEARLAVTGATEVHRALSAPERLAIGDYEVASRSIAARHISGDFIYRLELPNETVILLADLMGKGLAAAMWMTHVVDLVHRSAECSTNISELLGRLNAEIVNSRVRAPLLSAVAISIRCDGIVRCASAGHPPAVVVRSTGASACVAAGPLLGVFANAHYAAEEISLESRDAIVAYSDGLVDAHGDSAHELSAKQVAMIAAQARAGGPELQATRLIEAATSGGAAPADDASVVVVGKR